MIEDIEPLEEIDRANPLAAIIDEAEPVNEYREASLIAMEFMQNCARTIKEYKGDPVFVFECWLLSMGWYHLLADDRKDQSSLAAAYKNKQGAAMTKANVNKLVKKFQSFLNLPGERSESGRAKMSQSRKEQLK